VVRTEKRRNAEKGCAFLLACLAMIAAFAGGWPLLIAGFGQQREADNIYTVDFRHDHDDCGASKLTIDLDTGRALQCVPLGVRPDDGGADLPGFTDAQNEQVIELAVKLSPDGLTAPERQQIQDLVDKFAATVPAAERGDRHSGLFWGARLAWMGVALELVALLLYLFVIRTPRSARLPKPVRPPRGKHS
jgi:hypothetical protein